MPKFSQESFSKLSTCHIDLQTLFYEVVRSVDCSILEGHRNEVDQNAAYETGKSQKKWPDGKHNANPSMAVDVAIYPIDWENIKRFFWFAGFVQGIAQRLKDEGKISHNIRWGGNWSQDLTFPEQKLNDLVHFELI